MAYDVTAHLETALKMFVYDFSGKPEVAADRAKEALRNAIEFTFPYNGDGKLWRKKFLKVLTGGGRAE